MLEHEALLGIGSCRGHAPPWGLGRDRLDIEPVLLGLFFRRVRDRVLSATQGRQEPFTFGSLGATPFYFNPKPPNRPPPH